MDNCTEICWLGIARTTDVEFLLNKELCLERNIGLCISDADYSTGEGHLIHCHLVCRSAAHCLDDYVGTEACSKLLQFGVSILGLGVNGVCSTKLLGQCQLLVVDVGSYYCCTAQSRAHNCAEAHHSATDYNNGVDISNLSAIHCVETYTHGLDECTGAWVESLGWDYFLPRQSYELAHSAVTLHAQSLVVLAGVYTLVAARSTFSAVCVWIAGNHHARLQYLRHVGTHLLDNCAHLVTGYYGHFYHWVLT